MNHINENQNGFDSEPTRTDKPHYTLVKVITTLSQNM